MERWRGKGNEGAEGARQGRGELKKEEGVGRWGCCGLYQARSCVFGGLGRNYKEGAHNNTRADANRVTIEF